MLEQIEGQIQRAMRETYDRKAIRSRIESEYLQQKDKLTKTEAAIQLNEEARVVLQAIEQTQQAELKVKLERLISYALQTIFQRDLKFVVEFDVRGQQTEAVFKILDELGTTMPIKDAHGGGLLVVAAFLLKVIVLLSTRPALRPFIVDDEPFVHVNGEAYRERLIEFLKRLVLSSGVQLIVVTGLPELGAMGDRTYRFSLKNGKTVAEAI